MHRSLCVPLVLTVVVALLLVPQSAVAAVSLGDASGTVTVNGKKIPMKFAYAKAATEEGQRTTTVILTDRPAGRSLLGDPNRLQKAVEAAELQTLILDIAADGALKQVVFRSTALENKSFPLSSVKTAFTTSSRSGNSITAKAKSTEPQTFFDDSASFDVSFSAAIGDEKFADSPAALKQLAANAPKIGPGGAAGTLTFDGVTAKLTHAFATTHPNPFDETKTDIVVYITDRPVDRSMILNHRNLVKAIEDGMAGMIVTIDDKETPNHVEFLRKDSSIQISGSGFFNFDPVQFDRTRVEGRFFTTKPEDFMKHTYAYDVAFRSAVESVIDPRQVPVDASSGKKLPPDGGEPGKAFLALDKAIRAGSLAQIAKLSAKGVDSPFDGSPEEQKQALEMIRFIQPAKIKIVEGWSNAERATLRVTGVDPTEKGKRVNGTVHLVFEDGAWKIVAQKWTM